MVKALVKARLTPETWRLEIVSDGSTQIEKPRKLDDASAIATLEKALELDPDNGVVKGQLEQLKSYQRRR